MTDRQLGCKPGQVDMRFCGWKIRLLLFINPQGLAVFELRDPQSEELLFFITWGAWPLPALEFWTISRLRYRTDEARDQYVLEDIENDQRLYCGMFRLVDRFDLIPFVANEEGTWPPAIFSSLGLGDPQRTTPLPEDLDAFFDQRAAECNLGDGCEGADSGG